MVKVTLNLHHTLAAWESLARKQVKGKGELRLHSRAFAALKKGACEHHPEVKEEKDETGKVTTPYQQEHYIRKGGDVVMGLEVFQYFMKCINQCVDDGVQGANAETFDELCTLTHDALEAFKKEEEEKEKAA
jgi:hypothetical protein